MSYFAIFPHEMFNRLLNNQPLFLSEINVLMKKFFPVLSLFGLIACKNGDKNGGDGPQVPDAPKIMNYSIISAFPHDTSSYTQGLLIYKGGLYEGTGNYGKSKLMKVDLKTGKAEQQISLDPKFFGEGITILNDTVYQLTWREKKVFVYTVSDLKKVKEFDLGHDGWGLTNDGKSLIASNGSSTLYYYEPATFKLLKTQDVTEAGSLSYNLNELEFIDGFIYANQYEAPYILKIDPATGGIVAKADLSKQWDVVQQAMPHISPSDIVPNGIAYDALTKKIYITGKWWPELYEVQFSQ